MLYYYIILYYIMNLVLSNIISNTLISLLHPRPFNSYPSPFSCPPSSFSVTLLSSFPNSTLLFPLLSSPLSSSPFSRLVSFRLLSQLLRLRISSPLPPHLPSTFLTCRRSFYQRDSKGMLDSTDRQLENPVEDRGKGIYST